ncbi:GTP-binding protein [Streptomyces sp. NPDC059525]|uniref:EF-Tu C-terminal domain-related protein n=1 Tax=Streptomyces sp. NPDC059525 TaxID=3346857 RepID=UPI0036C57816
MVNQRLSGTGKPPVQVGIIGQDGHGKTTLSSAIMKVMSGAPRVGAEFNGDRGTARALETITGNECESESRHYSLVDFSSHADCAKGLIAGFAPMAAILVVAAPDGPTAQTRVDVVLARQVGVPRIVVALNKADLADEEALDRTEREVLKLLDECGFNGEDAPVVRVSALKAQEGDTEWSEKLLGLAKTLDEKIPAPSPAEDQPLLLAIEDVFTLTGKGTVATGRVERGTLNLNDQVDILGVNEGLKGVTITGIEAGRKTLTQATAGDSVGVQLEGVSRDSAERGQCIVTPGSITTFTKFKTVVYLLSTEEGGRPVSFSPGYRPQFYFRTTDMNGHMSDFLTTDATGQVSKVDLIKPGEYAEMTVELIHPVAMEKGTAFSIREGGRVVGLGRVTGTIK